MTAKKKSPTVFRSQDTGDKLNRPLADFADDVHSRLLDLENSSLVVTLDFYYQTAGGSAGSWPQRVALPNGFTPRIVIIGQIFRPDLAGTPASGIACPAWHVDGGALCIDYITGLANNTRYIINLQVSR